MSTRSRLASNPAKSPLGRRDQFFKSLLRKDEMVIIKISEIKNFFKKKLLFLKKRTQNIF